MVYLIIGTMIFLGGFFIGRGSEKWFPNKHWVPPPPTGRIPEIKIRPRPKLKVIRGGKNVG